MGFDFRFSSLQDTRQLKQTINFLARQDLGYPNYDRWVQRTEYELDKGYKEAILAFSEDRVVGDLVYQPHKEIQRVLELKNLRIHPDLRMRDFGRFMLKQVEVENSGKYNTIICDCRANQTEVVKFLKSCNYFAVTTIPLYEKDRPEVVLTKFLRKPESPLFLPNIKSLIEEKAL